MLENACLNLRRNLSKPQAEVDKLQGDADEIVVALIMDKKKKQSVDAKVAKAQLHAYEVLSEHVEDAKPSVDGFETMIEKMVKGGAEGSDYKRSALLNKNQQIDDRYKELLNSAVD
ncbi:hypothetical protein CRE_05165 [Caenorhabditis remanei]|uniref:Uncharacterized protein n=1 Tax=Caenorhabditis remanei TaxID=31234 RepID=E3N6E4_CAERE|nr:hypothetical protein CRE_05165 [Caenorhabditis remanei]